MQSGPPSSARRNGKGRRDAGHVTKATLETIEQPAKKRSDRNDGSNGPAALTRILNIHQRLSTGQSLDAVQLAKELSLSPRTIKRDIERLRDFHGAPIEWDRRRRTYFYTRPFLELPLLNLTAKEALVLALAGDTFAAWRGSLLGGALASAFAKIGGTVGDAITLPASELAGLITPAAEGPDTQSENRAFPHVLDAILRRQTLRFVYRKPHGPATTRVVHPLHLACLDHRWALVAWDPQETVPKRFVLSRMSSFATETNTFQPPPDFDIRAHLAASFGLYAGEKLEIVRLRFDAYAAPYIKERQWHASQAIIPRDDGGIEVELKVGHLLDVRRWILSWGKHVEALEPALLRQEIAAEIEALQSAYAPEIAVSKSEKNSGAGHPVSPALS